MDDDYGADFITLEDEDGNETELEVLDSFDWNGESYMALLPADMDEDDEDFGIIMLRCEEKDGEELLVSIDDDEQLQAVYDYYMAELFDEGGEEEPGE